MTETSNPPISRWINDQALAKKQDPEQHVDQGIDEITQAGLEHLAAGDCVDERQPVGRDEQRAQGQHEQQLATETRFILRRRSGTTWARWN